jgi:hypothetical protein
MVQAEPGYRGNVEPAGQWRVALPRRFAATASAFRREATRWHRQCGRRPRITPGPPIRRCRACALRWSPPCMRRQYPAPPLDSARAPANYSRDWAPLRVHNPQPSPRRRQSRQPGCHVPLRPRTRHVNGGRQLVQRRLASDVAPHITAFTGFVRNGRLSISIMICLTGLFLQALHRRARRRACGWITKPWHAYDRNSMTSPSQISIDLGGSGSDNAPSSRMAKQCRLAASRSSAPIFAGNRLWPPSFNAGGQPEHNAVVT